MSFTLIIECSLIVLLLATIIYVFVLNSRIKLIDENKDHLKQLLRGFSTSLIIAEKSIQKIKIAEKESSLIIDKNLKEVKKLCSDLEMLSNRGEEIADNIEKSIKNNRNFKFKHNNISEIKEKNHQKEENSNITNGYIESADENNDYEEKRQLLMGHLKTLR